MAVGVEFRLPSLFFFVSTLYNTQLERELESLQSLLGGPRKKGQAGFANFQLTPTVIMKDFLSRGSQEKCYLSNASVHIETPFKHQPRFVVVVAAKIAELAVGPHRVTPG